MFRMNLVLALVFITLSCHASEKDSLINYLGKCNTNSRVVLFARSGQNCAKCEIQVVSLRSKIKSEFENWETRPVRLFTRKKEAIRFRNTRHDDEYAMDLATFHALFKLERQPAWIAIERAGSVIASGYYGVSPVQEEAVILDALKSASASRISGLHIANTVKIIEPADSLFENLSPGNLSASGTRMIAVDRGPGRIHIIDLASGISSMRLSLPDSIILHAMDGREKSTLGTPHAKLMKPATVHSAYFVGEDTVIVLAEVATLVSDSSKGRPGMILAGKSILARYCCSSSTWSSPSAAIMIDGAALKLSLHNTKLQGNKLLIGNPIYRSPFPSYDSIRTISVYDLSTREFSEWLRPDSVYKRTALTYGLMDTYGTFIGDSIYAVQKLGSTLNNIFNGTSRSLLGGDFISPGGSLPSISQDSVAREKSAQRMARTMSYTYANTVIDLTAVNDHVAATCFLLRKAGSSRHMIALLDVRGAGTVSTYEYPDQSVRSVRFIDGSPEPNSMLVLVRNDDDYLIQQVKLH